MQRPRPRPSGRARAAEHQPRQAPQASPPAPARARTGPERNRSGPAEAAAPPDRPASRNHNRRHPPAPSPRVVNALARLCRLAAPFIRPGVTRSIAVRGCDPRRLGDGSRRAQARACARPRVPPKVAANHPARRPGCQHRHSVERSQTKTPHTKTAPPPPTVTSPLFAIGKVKGRWPPCDFATAAICQDIKEGVKHALGPGTCCKGAAQADCAQGRAAAAAAVPATYSRLSDMRLPAPDV